MSIQFECDHCGRSYQVSDSLAGKRVKCKGCEAPITIPKPSANDLVDDAFGFGDGDEGDVVEAVLPRASRGTRQPGDSSGVPVALLAGGGAGLLVVVLGAVFLLSGRAKPPIEPAAPLQAEPVVAEAPVPEAPPAVAPAVATAPPVVAPGGFATGAWGVAPDPLPQAIAFPPLEKLAIQVPNAFAGERILYPTTASPFVILGGNDADDQYREVWDLSSGQAVGRIFGKMQGGKPYALSPDGAYFVMHTSPVPRFTEVWRVADGQRVAQIPDGDKIPDLIDFAGAGRVIIGTTYAKSLVVWDFTTMKPVFTISTPENVDAHSLAFSPGRRFLAMYMANKNRVMIYDLTTGRQAGDIRMQKQGSSNFDCEGMAISPDGTALAGLFTLGSDSHLICWNLANGELVSDFESKGRNPYGKSFSYDSRVVQWLPDQSGWLIQDQTFVERQGGQVVWSMPFPPIKYKEHGPRKVLDLGRVVSLAEVNKEQVIHVAALPKEKIEIAIKLAKGGLNAIDAILPPVATADRSGAKKVASGSGSSAWSYAPTAPPAAKGAPARSIAVKVKAGDVLNVLLSNPDGGQALVVSSPDGRLSNLQGKQSQEPRTVGRFDLNAGRQVDQFEMPSVASPIAFSPGGSHFLVGYSAGRDRLDLHEAEKGKHVAGWRPYEPEMGDDRQVVWADFLDAKRVLTLNRSGTLILWSVPECKADYVAERAAKGVPALSPDRKGLAVIGQDGKFRVLNPETGESLGETAVFGQVGETGLAAAGFSPDGQELAAVIDGQIVRWDLKTGQNAGEVPSPNPKAATLRYGEGHHVLLDGKVLFDLESKRIVWRFDGGVHAVEGFGGLHRYVASQEILGPGILRTIDLPDKAIVEAEKALGDEKTAALLRPGSKIGLQVNGQPSRDAEKFRNDLYQGVSAAWRVRD